MPNIEALNAVADLIEYTDRFDITSFANGPNRRGTTAEEVWGDCGTTACFAGWTNVWAGAETELDMCRVDEARIELGLGEETADSLFFGYGAVWGQAAAAGVIPNADDPDSITAAQAAAILRALADGTIPSDQ